MAKAIKKNEDTTAYIVSSSCKNFAIPVTEKCTITAKNILAMDIAQPVLPVFLQQSHAPNVGNYLNY